MIPSPNNSSIIQQRPVSITPLPINSAPKEQILKPVPQQLPRPVSQDSSKLQPQIQPIQNPNH